MNKRQYTFLFLLSVLLYLSYTVVKYEYNSYINEKYKEQQRIEIAEIKESNRKGKIVIEYRKTRAYINKSQKKELNKKMKWETVVNITEEDTYKKFTSTHWFSENEDQLKESPKKHITYGMSNFQKWIYFLFNKKD